MVTPPGLLAVQVALLLALAAAAGGAVWLTGRSRIGAALLRRARSLDSAGLAPSRAALLVWAAGTAAVALGPHLGLALAGAALAAWGAWRFERAGTRRVPWAGMVVLLSVAPALWFLATVAGPEGLSFAAIPYLPLSPAAERLVAPLVFTALWALAGLWPLRQPAGGTLTAPLGALLFLRLGLAAVPAGLAHWRAAFFPLVVLGTWHAALAGRRTALAVAGATLGLASLHPLGLAGAAALLAAAVLLELGRRGVQKRPAPHRRVRQIAIVLLAGPGALAAAAGGLHAETVWTVLALAGAAAGLAVSRADACEGPR